MKLLGVGWVGAATADNFAVLTYVARGCVKGILRPMKEGNPFDKGTSRHIKTLAWLSLDIGIVQNIASAVELFVSYNTFKLHDLLISENVKHVNFNFTFESGFIIVFLVLLLMSYVFDYGAELQQLSDETL